MAQLVSFAYTALDAGGARRSGVIDAETKDAAVAQLGADGRFVLEIKEQGSTPASDIRDMKRKRQPSRQDIALFTRRMADLSTAGLPLDRVLHPWIGYCTWWPSSPKTRLCRMSRRKP
jgi:type IV pilus assembly protein PilC